MDPWDGEIDPTTSWDKLQSHIAKGVGGGQVENRGRSPSHYITGCRWTAVSQSLDPRLGILTSGSRGPEPVF